MPRSRLHSATASAALSALSVDAAGGHRVPGFCECEQARAGRDRLAGDAVRVARAVPALVVVADPAELLVVERPDCDLCARVRVVANLLELALRERARLAEHRLADAELADVVQEAGLSKPDREVGMPAAGQRQLLGQARNALRVSFGAGIFRVELACERAQPAEAAIVLDLELRVVAVELGAVPERRIAARVLRVDESDFRESEQLVGPAHVLEVADAGGRSDTADTLDRWRRASVSPAQRRSSR